jgi:hypothetical protein
MYEDPVIAIMESSDSYLLFSHNRGVHWGEPVKAAIRDDAHPTYFAREVETARG